MARKKYRTSDYFQKMHGLTYGGAVALKGTDVLAHAGTPTALAGDIGGLAQLGVASGFGHAAMGLALRPMQEAERRQRRKRKRKKGR